MSDHSLQKGRSSTSNFTSDEPRCGVRPSPSQSHNGTGQVGDGPVISSTSQKRYQTLFPDLGVRQESSGPVDLYRLRVVRLVSCRGWLTPRTRCLEEFEVKEAEGQRKGEGTGVTVCQPFTVWVRTLIGPLGLDKVVFFRPFHTPCLHGKPPRIPKVGYFLFRL